MVNDSHISSLSYQLQCCSPNTYGWFLAGWMKKGKNTRRERQGILMNLLGYVGWTVYLWAGGSWVIVPGAGSMIREVCHSQHPQAWPSLAHLSDFCLASRLKKERQPCVQTCPSYLFPSKKIMLYPFFCLFYSTPFSLNKLQNSTGPTLCMLHLVPIISQVLTSPYCY